MIARQGTFVEYSVFGKETTADWTFISDAKGQIHNTFFSSVLIDFMLQFLVYRTDHSWWSLQ